MKNKNLIRIIGGTIVLTFLILYTAQATGYYEIKNDKRTTNEAIKRYEADLKKGKAVDVKDYIQEEKVYSNRITKITSKVSRGIEKGMNSIMNYLFKQMSRAVDEK